MSPGPARGESERIALLELRAVITDLVHRYATNIHRRKPQDCRSLFTDQATFEVREATPGDPGSVRTVSKLSGAEAIVNYIGRSAEGGGVCPMIHNLLIDISGDTATSTCVMAATVWALGQVMVGEYEDSFRRDTEWRFTSRVYTIFRQGA